MQWFTADGFFVAKPFQQWLASGVPLIGEADPKNASNDLLLDSTDKSVGSAQVPASGSTSSQKRQGVSKRRQG